MKVVKDKHMVKITCLDGSSIKGIIHVSQGLRILDFLNDAREKFVAVTNVEGMKKTNTIMLSKATIKYVEDAEEQ